MTIFERYKLARIEARRLEENLFSYAHEEFEIGVLRKGLWAKALSSSGGNASKAYAEYLKLRVDSLKDDREVLEQVLRETRDARQTRETFDGPESITPEESSRERLERVKRNTRANHSKNPPPKPHSAHSTADGSLNSSQPLTANKPRFIKDNEK